MTEAAAQVSSSRCEAHAAIAARPVISGVGVIVRANARSHRCTNSLHEFVVQPSLRAPSKCGRRGAWAARSAGGQLPFSVSAGHVTRRLWRRCRRREGPHAHSPRDAHSLPTSKTMHFPQWRLPCASLRQLTLSPFELNSAQLEPFGRSAGRLRKFCLCFLIYITQDLARRAFTV